MPRYFFNIKDGGRDEDEIGTDLTDTATARKEAVRYAGAVLTSEPELIWDGHDFRVEVIDDQGRHITTIVALAVDALAAGG